ncbi:MAG: type I methionyl aminopeptidase [Oscillospiraceae bacterium]|nr:type I methionyl aminopeptidase [Oscillospiraceae bacterium]
MIILKTSRELSLMRDAGRIAAEALRRVGEMVKPGVTTMALARAAHDYIVKCGAAPTFLDYNGFPGSICVSVNDEVIHGIPSEKRTLREGDLVGVDLGATYHGYVGDTAASFAVGAVSEELRLLSDTARESLYLAIEQAWPGGRLGDISAAVQTHCEARGYSLVREYCGHGVGRVLHEDPGVPNVGVAGRGLKLKPGMTLAIEPMVNQGRAAVKLLPDGWTVKTRDGKPSAHFEHTVAITSEGPVILTKVEG